MALSLTVIATGHSLATPAAASYARLTVLFGGTIPIPKPLGAFRSFAQQQELRDLFLAGKGAFALPPGNSQHELGLAMDVGKPARTWMKQNAGPHGWRRSNPKEAWHFEYNAAHDQFAGGPAPAAPFLLPRKAPDMFVTHFGASLFRLVTGDRIVSISKDAAMALKAAGIPLVALPNADVEQLQHDLAPQP
jgi:hypothetical protein